jgi:hypothetical protein
LLLTGAGPPQAFDKGFLRSLRLPMKLAELQRRLGSEGEHFERTSHYQWELHTRRGTDLLSVWTEGETITTVHILHDGTFWLIDRFNRRCAPDRLWVWECAPRYPPP